MIVNRLMAWLPDLPENWSTPIAPSKPALPMECSARTVDAVASVQQDPIFRNLTETMGVFMPIDLRSKSPAEGLFQSNAAICSTFQGREPIGAPGAAAMAGGSVRQDRPRQGKGGKSTVHDTLRRLPQRLALHVDRAQQIRQALHSRRTDTAIICRHRSRAIPRSAALGNYRATEQFCRASSAARNSCRRATSTTAFPGRILETALSKAEADRRGEAEAAWLSRVPAAQAAGGCLQGGAA